MATSGGGAAAVVVDIVNEMFSNADDRYADGIELVNRAINAADPAPFLDPVTIESDYEAPPPPGIDGFDPAGSEALYDSKEAQLRNLITTNFSSFINTYFPNPTYFQHAIDWCDRAVQQGGSGIDANVEQALWQRGRARVLADSERAEREADMVWANRRFPLPPGALVSLRGQINLDAGRKLAEINRDIAVKSFDTEIENVRFAVKEVIDQRKVALDAAGEYIKTLMLGPQTASQITLGLANVQAEFARALTSMYSAQVAAAEPGVRLAIADAQIRLEGEKANLDAKKDSIEQKVRATMGGAQIAAQQSSAGINAINAQASISGNDSSQV